MAVAVGFALVWIVVPTVGKRVFLRVVSTIPTVMRCMTPSAATVKKSGLRPFKKSGFRRYKNSYNRSPSPTLPKGRESHPPELEVIAWHSFPLGKAGMGPVTLPFPIAAIPHEKRTHPD